MVQFGILFDQEIFPDAIDYYLGRGSNVCDEEPELIRLDAVEIEPYYFSPKAKTQMSTTRKPTTVLQLI